MINNQTFGTAPFTMSDIHGGPLIEIKEGRERIGIVLEHRNRIKAYKVKMDNDEEFEGEVRSITQEGLDGLGWKVEDGVLFRLTEKEVRICSDCEQELFKQEKFLGEDEAKYYCPICG